MLHQFFNYLILFLLTLWQKSLASVIILLHASSWLLILHFRLMLIQSRINWVNADLFSLIFSKSTPLSDNLQTASICSKILVLDFLYANYDVRMCWISELLSSSSESSWHSRQWGDPPCCLAFCSYVYRSQQSIFMCGRILVTSCEVMTPERAEWGRPLNPIMLTFKNLILLLEEAAALICFSW